MMNKNLSKKIFSIITIQIIATILISAIYIFFIFTPAVNFKAYTEGKNIIQLFTLEYNMSDYKEEHYGNYRTEISKPNFTQIKLKLSKNTDISRLRVDFGDRPSEFLIKDFYIQPNFFTKYEISNDDFQKIFQYHHDIKSINVTGGG